MHRAINLVLIAMILIVFSMLVREDASAQTFATNTPRPTAFSFATNTPSGPTGTPTNTLTPTPTNTATLTPSSTPTLTPTPTNTSTPTATFTPTSTPTPTPTPNGPYFYPEGVNALTGQLYPDQESMSRRNLIVKISNYPPVVRPQSGVNQADVVYEFEAEGGVTRFAVIFRSNMPEHVGPVRSARLVDLEMIPMYNALFAYSGTSEPIQRLILASEYVYQTFAELKGDGCPDTGFCRFPQDRLDFEHTLYLDTSILYEKATRREVNTGLQARGFAFSDDIAEDGLPANEVYIEWYGQADARWQYQPDTERYVRFSDGVPHIDAVDGQQLWVDNLVVIEVPHVERPDLFPPGANYTSSGIELWGQGRAIVIRQGRVYQGFWRREDERPGSALQLIYPGSPAPIMLKPGRTWVSVVRSLGNASVMEAQVDVMATATAVALTPTRTPIPVSDD